MKGLRELDDEHIRANINEQFYMVVGSRNDPKILELIPLADNIMVHHEVCIYCKNTASFQNLNGKHAVCRGCKLDEVERALKMDAQIQKTRR